MSGRVIVDVAGAQMGGAARFAAELRRYLAATGRTDVTVMGESRTVRPAWLVRREILGGRTASRRVALNNISFVAPGSERWVLLRNALHFLAPGEARTLDPGVRASVRRESAIVRAAARRADRIVVPCTAMGERVKRAQPSLAGRIVVRPHPVSADLTGTRQAGRSILVPVLFAPYKQMDDRLAELLAALTRIRATSVQVMVTASRPEISASVAGDPRLLCLGRPSSAELTQAWARCAAIYYPTRIESFGYPLAEARAAGVPVIALATAQNAEIAGKALCGYEPDDPRSLAGAVSDALMRRVEPDPAPFDPGPYFDWLLGTGT